MAALLIREYSHLARDDFGQKGWAVAEPAVASDTFTTTGTSSVIDNEITDETRFVYFSADATTRIEFGPRGTTPVAGGDSLLLLAGQECFVAVAPNTVIAARSEVGAETITLTIPGWGATFMIPNWTSVAGATSYELTRVGFGVVYTGGNFNFVDSGLDQLTEYCYTIEADTGPTDGPVCETTGAS